MQTTPGCLATRTLQHPGTQKPRKVIDESTATTMSSALGGLLKHSAIYWIGNMATKMVGFLLIPIYTAYLLPADYGTLELIALTADVIVMVLGVRLASAIFKYYHASDTQEDRNAVISTGVLSVIGLVTGSGVLLFSFTGDISQTIFGHEKYGLLFRIMFVSALSGIVLETVLSYLRIKERSRLFVVITVTHLLGMVSLNIVFVVFMQMSIMGVLLGSAISGLVICLLLVVSVLREVGFAFRRSQLEAMIRYSAPLVPAAVGMFIIHFSDRYFLNHFGTLAEVGIYALAYKFGFLVSQVVAQPFSMVWSSSLFVFYSRADRNQLYNRTFTWFSYVVILATLGLSLFIDEILMLMTPVRYWPAASLVPIIAWAYALNGLALVLLAPLYAEKRTGIIGTINGFAALINIVACYFLIARYGVFGAAVATVISFACILICTAFMTRRIGSIEWEWRGVAIAFLIGLSLVVMGRLVQSGSALTNLLIKLALFGAYLPLLRFSNCIRAEDMELIRTKVAGQLVRIRRTSNPPGG